MRASTRGFFFCHMLETSAQPPFFVFGLHSVAIGDLLSDHLWHNLGLAVDHHALPLYVLERAVVADVVAAARGFERLGEVEHTQRAVEPILTLLCTYRRKIEAWSRASDGLVGVDDQLPFFPFSGPRSFRHNPTAAAAAAAAATASTKLRLQSRN